VYFSDGTWSDGIVSAAKEVGVSAKELFQLGQKDIDDSDHLLAIINTTQQITSFTVQILTASTVYSLSSSKSQLILNSTGKQLMSTNEKLVKLCQEKISQEKIEKFSLSKSHTSRNAEEMDAKLNILKLEKELDRARIRLGSIRKVRYSMSGNSSIKKPQERNQSLEANFATIDQETMNTAIERANVLSMINTLDDSPEFFSQVASSDSSKASFATAKTGRSSIGSTSRRDFSPSFHRLSRDIGNSNNLNEIKEEK
jgi:hypothetical protein